MNKNDLRKFALLILDEPNGINKKAYDLLEDELIKQGHSDITEKVDTLNGRTFIADEDFATAELEKIYQQEE